MGSHINEKGEFQSDKYPTCPPGKVPLSVKDKMAQDLLWIYAYAAYVVARSQGMPGETPREHKWTLGEHYACALGVYHYQRAIEPLSYDDLIAAIDKALNKKGEQ